MRNLKIRVNEDNASEVIDLLVVLGHKTLVPKEKLLREVANGYNQIADAGNGLFTTVYFYDVKEITLPELRAMVNQEQDEPFLTPETTLNDQYAEIEEVRQAEIHGTIKAEPDLNFGAAQASGGIDATLAQRQSTYGNFEDVAFVTENIMSVLGSVRVNGLNELPNTHRMALYMIASKMARIVNGDFNHIDGWHDIGGYSKLIEKLIKGE